MGVGVGEGQKLREESWVLEKPLSGPGSMRTPQLLCRSGLPRAW